MLILLCHFHSALLKSCLQQFLLILSVETLISSANMYAVIPNSAFPCKPPTYLKIGRYSRHGRKVRMTVRSLCTHLSGISSLSCNIAWEEHRCCTRREAGGSRGELLNNGSFHMETDKESERIQAWNWFTISPPFPLHIRCLELQISPCVSLQVMWAVSSRMLDVSAIWGCFHSDLLLLFISLIVCECVVFLIMNARRNSICYWKCCRQLAQNSLISSTHVHFVSLVHLFVCFWDVCVWWGCLTEFTNSSRWEKLRVEYMKLDRGPFLRCSLSRR